MTGAPPAPAEVTAVVLTGGRSTRMGRDKASLVPDDGDPRTLARRVLDALSPLAAHALLAGPPVADTPGVAAIADHYAQAGPLGGVASALAAVGTPYAVVAACDMPTVVPALVGDLLRRAAAAPDALCVLCVGPRGPEPLLAVWRPAAAPRLRAALDHGVRVLREAVAALPHLAVPAEEWRRVDPAGASFANWNRPDDLP